MDVHRTRPQGDCCRDLRSQCWCTTLGSNTGQAACPVCNGAFMGSGSPREPFICSVLRLTSICINCVSDFTIAVVRMQVCTVAGSWAWRPLRTSCCDHGFAAAAARVGTVQSHPSVEKLAIQSSYTRSFTAKAPKLKPYSSYRERFRTSADGFIKYQRPGHRHRRFRKRCSCHSSCLHAC